LKEKLQKLLELGSLKQFWFLLVHIMFST